MQVERADFVAVPARDGLRLREFYVETLGLRPDDRAQYEVWAGDLCIAIWEPERLGMPFAPAKNGHIALRVPDVHEARAELEATGVTFSGDTIDPGVCHIAGFDSGGNSFILHHRYAPYADGTQP